MAVAAMEFASGQKDEALKSVKKVTDPRYRDLRYVAVSPPNTRKFCDPRARRGEAVAL
jgi:hypothetical protein